MNISNVRTGKNVYCGPAVLSAITGCTTDEAATVIQDILGNKRAVVGVYPSNLCEAFRRLGYHCTYYTHLANAGSLFYVLSVLSDGVYVIVVPGHYVCVEVEGKNRFFIDNHTKKPINAAVSARGQMKVQAVIGVRKVD